MSDLTGAKPVEPNFRCVFEGGPFDGENGFLNIAREELDWIVPVTEKGEMGKPTGTAKWLRVVYRLSSHGPPSLYSFARSTDCDESGNPLK